MFEKNLEVKKLIAELLFFNLSFCLQALKQIFLEIWCCYTHGRVVRRAGLYGPGSDSGPFGPNFEKRYGL